MRFPVTHPKFPGDNVPVSPAKKTPCTTLKHRIIKQLHQFSTEYIEQLQQFSTEYIEQLHQFGTEYIEQAKQLQQLSTEYIKQLQKFSTYYIEQLQQFSTKYIQFLNNTFHTLHSTGYCSPGETVLLACWTGNFWFLVLLVLFRKYNYCRPVENIIYGGL
jgi:cytoplasmic iron level regulating protein YaaA (DUF328/UPF0246 family)